MQDAKRAEGSKRPSLVPALLLAVGLWCHAVAAAAYTTEYTFTIETGGAPVTNGMLLERGPEGTGRNVVGLQFDNGTTSTQISYWQPIAPTTSLMIFIVNGLPGDLTDPVDHIVLFMDDTTASSSAGKPWGDLFSTGEEWLIDTLKLATDFSAGPNFDAIDAIIGWADGEAATAGAWFSTGGTFTVQAWSDAAAIGSGTSSVVSSVPEPGTLALLGLGLAGLGLSRRRKAH